MEGTRIMGNQQLSTSGDFHSHEAGVPRPGRLTEWLDDKGYGWVESDGERIFAHIKDFRRGQPRPRKGDEVRFHFGIDTQGRRCAKELQLLGTGTPPIRTGLWFCLGLLLVLPLWAMSRLPIDCWMGPLAMAILSAIAYAMHFHDKQQALVHGWRTSENSLHLIELLGGWPGAFLAQRRLRHKCSKITYQIIYWGIVTIHQMVALDLILSHRLSRILIEFIKALQSPSLQSP